MTGRDAARAEGVAAELGGNTTGLGFDLAAPEAIGEALSGVGAVDNLVLAAIERDNNRAREYHIASATRLVTLKLIGYTEVVHALVLRGSATRARWSSSGASPRTGPTRARRPSRRSTEA